MSKTTAIAWAMLCPLAFVTNEASAPNPPMNTVYNVMNVPIMTLAWGSTCLADAPLVQTVFHRHRAQKTIRLITRSQRSPIRMPWSALLAQGIRRVLAGDDPVVWSWPLAPTLLLMGEEMFTGNPTTSGIRI